MSTTTKTLPSHEEINQIEPFSRCVLVTDFGDDGENVLNYTRLPAEVIEAALIANGATFGECYEIPAEDTSLYCFEPSWLSDTLEHTILDRLSA